MRNVLAGACLLLLVVAARAEEGDGESLRRAQAAVEQHLSDVDREKTRVVWPEIPDETPPEGAEVLLIHGYIGYALHRLIWREGRIDAVSANATRAWLYDRKGEVDEARRFHVSDLDFALAWNAARRVIGARRERVAPEPEDRPLEGGGVTFRSHEPERWTRLAVGASEPLFTGRAHGRSLDCDEVTDWRCIRDDAVFDLLNALVPTTLESLPAEPLELLREPLTLEVRRATSSLDLGWAGGQEVLLESSLRILGSAGDRDSLAAVEALDRRLAEEEDQAGHNVESLRDECEIARTAISMRLDWNEAAARRVILGNPGKKQWQNDLAKCTRARWRNRDLVSYARFLSEEATSAPDDGVLHAPMVELRGDDGAALRELLRGALTSPTIEERTRAAITLCEVPAYETEARTVLEDVARDPAIEAPPIEGGATWPRRLAMLWFVRHRLWGSGELRERLADSRENGRAVAVVLALLTRIGEPATDEEQIAAWSRALDVPGAGVLPAAEALLDARDLASLDRVAQALDAFEADPPAHIDVPTLNAALAGLRTKLDTLR